MFVLAVLATALLPTHRDFPNSVPGPVSVPGWPAHEITPGGHNLFTAWERFDGLWFLRIATKGYAGGDGSAAFFPLYPLAVRVVSFLIGTHPLAASLIVSNLAFLGALIVLYFLTFSELSPGAARKTVLYMSVFPTAFFFLAPYSESPFLLATVASFWAARRGKWWLAGLCGALAAATRMASYCGVKEGPPRAPPAPPPRPAAAPRPAPPPRCGAAPAAPAAAAAGAA